MTQIKGHNGTVVGQRLDLTRFPSSMTTLARSTTSSSTTAAIRPRRRGETSHRTSNSWRSTITAIEA
jgi:hypothetical protein